MSKAGQQKGSSFSEPRSKDNNNFLVGGHSRDNTFCFLRITEGRNFVLDDSRPLNLFISCRFFTSTDAINSAISWNTTRPSFHLQVCWSNNYYINLKNVKPG